ncbi:hypothetical protein SCLCIDRAFT_1213027 [Scleroderma citrinum Foug A]|uniref:DUF6533 domain-containing protein n=1 Tax=Scleroderma citrinum Foug A TaxID=1036808 RepID=A0A0C2ZTS7_9AGAM|nr:hypothetical protein SCLCIDRAFT_1213027 [Scleroderma citrinum Foug A]
MQPELNSNLTDIIANVIFYYDYVLTLQREVELFWLKPRRSWAFTLFIANRYIPIIARVPTLLELFWQSEDGTVCTVVTLYYERFEIIVVQLIGGAIMTMRIYALYEKSRRVLSFLVVYAIVCIAVACWATLTPESPGSPLVPSPPLQFGCSISLTVDDAQRLAIAWSGQLAFDAIVLSMTLWRSLRIRKLGNHALLDVLIRDGFLYFSVMCVANVGNIIALLMCNTATTKVAFATFTNSISVTLISRLMLNLRSPKVTASSHLCTPTYLRDGTLLVTTVVSPDFTCPSRFVDEPALELQQVSIRS